METAIVNALIVDGGGGAPFPGGVVLRGGRIVGVAPAPLPANFAAGAAERVDAHGLALAPGLIDAHGHSDLALMAAPAAAGKLAQGITTEIAGNCGLSAFPVTDANREHLQGIYAQYGIPLSWNSFSEYADAVERCRPGISLGLLCGHNSLRGAVRGYGPGEASPGELDAMRALLRKSLAEGALGLSTGLLYVPGKFASRDELVALVGELAAAARDAAKASPDAADAAVRRDGPKPSLPYATHLRSEGAALLEAIAEAVACCRAAGQKSLHISHLKTAGEANWGKLDAAFRLLDEARGQGLAVTADRYPYTTSLSQLGAYLPAPWDDMDDLALTRCLAAPDAAMSLAQALAARPPAWWARIRLVAAAPEFALPDAGESMAAQAAARDMAPAAFCVAALRAGAAAALAARDGMSEENLWRILAMPWACGGTDERALPPDGSLGSGHPRGYGGMARHLSWLTREFGLGEAVRRLARLPASVFGLDDRGRIAAGFAADLILLDPGHVEATAELASPFRLANGIHRAWVNGLPAWQDGAPTPRRAGTILRRSRTTEISLPACNASAP